MTTGESSIFLERVLNSPIERVWDAWTNPQEIMHWFGSDPNGRVLHAELDIRAGGHFEVTFQDADLAEHTCSGIYEEVQHPGKLTFSWQWKNEPGNTSFVIVLLTSEGSYTKMQFEHKNLGSVSKHNYAQGWESTFSKLERLLEISS